MYNKRFRKRTKRISGFSLAEILIGLVISSMLMTILLYIMVDLTSTSQLDQAHHSTNEEMKQALNYMATELREATYVYTGEELEEEKSEGEEEKSRTINGKKLDPIKNFLPNDFPPNTRPILAFWKVEPVPYSDSDASLPSSCTPFTDSKVNECNVLRIEQRAYTLVVYLQSTNNDKGEWKGDSRIYRYQLRKYSNPTDLTTEIGYVDPIINSTFQQWPYDLNLISAQEALPSKSDRNFIPLTDFVASPTFVNSSDTTQDDFNCPTTKDDGQFLYKPSPHGVLLTETAPNYKPTDAKSFFACVRDSSITTNQGFNQDVLLFLRGNAKGKPSVEQDEMLGMLQVQAISRGVVRKIVAD